MKRIFKKASDNLFSAQIELQPRVIKPEPLEGNFMVASITLQSGSFNYKFTLVMSDALLRETSSVLLFDDEPDHEAKSDLSLEVTNMIIGNAKVIIEGRSDEDLKLGIPQVIDLDIDIKDFMQTLSKEDLTMIFNQDKNIWFILKKEDI
jgi:hypothetical protein